jgi:hypothetical protein
MNAILTPYPVSHLADADMQAVPAALARAALRAREVAARTGTPLIVTKDGKLVEEIVQEPQSKQA